jgi:hypothetical protein
MLTAKVVAQVTTTADEAQEAPFIPDTVKGDQAWCRPLKDLERIGWMRWRTAHGYRTDVEAGGPGGEVE